MLKKKKTFGSSQGWFDSKTLFCVKASLCHKEAGEREKESAREDDGKCNRSGSLFGRERLHDLSDTGQALWPLSYQKTSFELYNISKELKASEWLKSARISVAEWLARPDVRLPRRVMVSVSTLMHGDSERINSTSPRNDLLCITFSRLIAT